MNAYVYIMASKRNGTIYIGVTNDLIRRVDEHKNKKTASFTSKYNVTRLVYYEEHPDIIQAIEREKQLKVWKRKRKLTLIEAMNPEWQDLFEEVLSSV